MVENKKVGLLDSGIGGFSLLRELAALTPPGVEMAWDYLADDFYAPYGERSAEEVVGRARLLTKRLVERNVDAIVVACNTATAVAIEALRDEFPEIPFVGVEPYLNVVHREPHLLQKGAKTAVLTTETMGKSLRFRELKKRLDPFEEITHYTSRHLASLVEEAFFKGAAEEWVTRLDEECDFLLREGFSQVILGCTHYPLLADYFRLRLGLWPISPCQHVARRVYNVLAPELSSVSSSVSPMSSNGDAIFWFFRTSAKEPTHYSLGELQLNLPQLAYESLTSRSSL